jgi:hypothetical protein
MPVPVVPATLEIESLNSVGAKLARLYLKNEIKQKQKG